MEFEESIDWGGLNESKEHDWYLTEDLFEKFSLRASLCEEEEKVFEKQVHSAFQEPKIPFQRKSNISIEDQKFFLETYMDYVAGKEIAFELVHRLQSLMWTLKAEQEEFSTLLQQHSLWLRDQYNFIHPQIKASVQKFLIGEKSRVQRLAPYYTLFQTVGLSSGAVFPNDPILRLDRIVKQAVGQTLLRLPSLDGSMKLSQNHVVEDVLANQAELCQDSTVHDISAQFGVHFVVTSDALQTLIDNHQPAYVKEWQLPLSVIDHTRDGSKNNFCQKTILIDDPLPPKSITPRDVNVLYYRYAVCKRLNGADDKSRENCVKQENLIDSLDGEGHLTRASFTRSSYDDESVSSLPQLSNSETEDKRNDSKEFEMKRQSSFENTEKHAGGLAINDKHKENDNENLDSGRFFHQKQKNISLITESLDSNTGHSLKKDNRDFQVDNPHFTYSLWTFGNLKLLIRSTDNGLLYQSKKGEKGALHPVNVFVKPEYQLTFGYEQITPSEASRMWISSYINPGSLCVCARVDPITSELLRLDVLNQAAIINLSSFNAAHPMKMIHNVLTRLLKLLEPGKFISSHLSGDIHTCIYEMVDGREVGRETTKASYDLHSVYSRNQEFLEYYEKSVPWVSVDPNMFLPWHIAHDRLPMTFPAVSSEELKKMGAGSQVGKKKKNKNKKNKTMGNKIPDPTVPKGFKANKGVNLTNNDYIRRLRNSKKLMDTDRPLCDSDAVSEILNADVKLSERLRGRSEPMSYYDIEFDF